MRPTSASRRRTSWPARRPSRWPPCGSAVLRREPTRGGSMSALWHPFAGMAAVQGNEVVLVRGEGVWLWDDEGRRYLDGSSSLWYANVGHGRREIAEAIARQLAEL